MKNLSDLEELILACHTDSARSYIAEAVACYNAGAYRACIVTTWIAVVFDLIDKIRELSIYGEKLAEEIFDKFKEYQKQINQNDPKSKINAMNFENEILKTAKDKLELLDYSQFSDLKRLHEDRHLCAHPSFQKIEEPYMPPAELARLHIKNAVEHVLKQPPVQGKSALGELRAKVKSQYFPEDTKQAIIRFESSPLSKPSDALVRGFIDSLIFELLKEVETPNELRRIIAAVNACLEMHRRITEKRIEKQINKAIEKAEDDFMFHIVALCLSINQGWLFLDESPKNKIENYIEKGAAEEVINILPISVEIQDLTVISNERINKFSVEEFSNLINIGGPKKEYVDSAVEFYCRVGSWVGANDVTEKIILPLFEYLTKDDVEKIIRAPRERKADLLGSHGFSLFVERLCKRNIIEREELEKMLIENGLEYELKSIKGNQ